MKKLLVISICLSLLLILSLQLSWASVAFVGDVANSTEKLGDFSGELSYSFTNSTLATLILSLKNTSSSDNGGYLTAFVFNNPLNYIINASLIATDADFDLIGGSSYNNGINGDPFGNFDLGASTGDSFQGGGNPNKGISEGAMETFTFTLTGTSLNTLNELSFISELSSSQSGQDTKFFVARFRGFDNDGSDKVPGTIPPVPEPGTMVLFGSGIFGLLASSFRKFFKQIKRGMDIVMASMAVVVTAPLWILIAIAIKLTSKGPVFFKQERVGENKRYSERRKEARSADRRAGQSFGRSFTMYKFRTMNIDAEKETGAIWALENDPRITTLGRFLRKTHLDELPQLLNVLKGEMSMIGPRPERAQIIPTLNKSIKKYGKRLRVKPGITGLAQVRQHYDTTLGDVKKKVHYDLLYIRKMCLLMDLRIIFGTFVVMLTGKGAR